MEQDERAVLLVREGPLLVGRVVAAEIHQAQRVVGVGHRIVKLTQRQPADPAMIILHKLAVGFLALGLDAAHGVWLVVLLAIGNALLGMALGLGVSALANTEFQAVQFMPALILPQLVLCGLLIERSEMSRVLYWISWALPLTYSYDALARATSPSTLGGWFALDVLVTIGCTVAALALGAATLERRTP